MPWLKCNVDNIATYLTFVSSLLKKIVHAVHQQLHGQSLKHSTSTPSNRRASLAAKFKGKYLGFETIETSLLSRM